MPLKYQKELDAWISGKQLQYKLIDQDESWRDIPEFGIKKINALWDIVHFWNREEYLIRIKPEEKILKYRIAIVITPTNEFKVDVMNYSDSYTEDELDSKNIFICWADEIQELNINSVLLEKLKIPT